MTKYVIFLVSLCSIIGLSSCEGCVKKTSKKVTEVGISALEGISEAIDEKGESLAEKTTDAAGKLVAGMSKSIDKQLDEHAASVASVAGRSTVQLFDGFTNGFVEEVKQHYIEIPYTKDFVPDVSLEYFAKHKSGSVVDAYFIILDGGEYTAKFECYDQQGSLFLTKDINIDYTNNTRNSKYTVVSFALNEEEKTSFDSIKTVHITVQKTK